ncbi:SDR family oxidoreductase [Dactylosporangium sp. CA-139066]|uniref:SDR family oxidoreductase n=1 Tax=Dactylosporangium sp. CA-139066 TaxID=3239930 RepID=UPI003D8A836A
MPGGEQVGDDRAHLGVARRQLPGQRAERAVCALRLIAGDHHVAPGRPGLRRAEGAELSRLTAAWAAEFGPYGIRVNTIAPGPTDVEWLSDLRPMLERMVSTVPSGRLARAEEVAAAAAFLASDEAAHIHGATLPVDGGLTAVTTHGAAARTAA